MLNLLLAGRTKLRGFTLIEMLVAVAIAGVIIAAIAATTTQTLSVSASTANHEDVIKQLENALHYLDRDVQMAWPGHIGTDNPSPYPRAFSAGLTLRWQDFTDPNFDALADNQKHVVTYSVNTSTHDLYRLELVDNVQSSNLRLAQHVSSGAADSNYTFASGILSAKLTADTGGFKAASGSRTVQTMPRTNQPTPTP